MSLARSVYVFFPRWAGQWPGGVRGPRICHSLSVQLCSCIIIAPNWLLFCSSLNLLNWNQRAESIIPGIIVVVSASGCSQSGKTTFKCRLKRQWIQVFEVFPSTHLPQEFVLILSSLPSLLRSSALGLRWCLCTVPQKDSFREVKALSIWNPHSTSTVSWLTGCHNQATQIFLRVFEGRGHFSVFQTLTFSLPGKIPAQWLLLLILQVPFAPESTPCLLMFSRKTFVFPSVN